MIGTNIKRLRTQKGMTQKNLADKLFVSAQAVSRWENNEVEPSIGTIVEMAKIFEVSVDEILGINNNKEPEVKIEKEYVYKEPPKQVLAVCHHCNNPIYETSDIVHDRSNSILCRSCYFKQKEHSSNVRIQKSQKRRMLSFIFGPLASIAALFLCIKIDSFNSPLNTAISVLFILGVFTLVSCCLLANNFIGYMELSILIHAFVKWPGLIISFDLDGCLFFIGMKILFFVLEILVAIAVCLFALLAGCAISLFVYPYAIIKNIRHPERFDGV